MKRYDKPIDEKDETIDTVLSVSDEELNGDTESEWKKVNDILYQPIVITGGNVTSVMDGYRDKMVEKAFVNFFFADDATQKPYVFSTAWNGIKLQIAELKRHNAFPLRCGVVEILEKRTNFGQFPLRLSSVSILAQRQSESIDSQLLADNTTANDAASSRANADAFKGTGGSAKNTPKTKPVFGNKGN